MPAQPRSRKSWRRWAGGVLLVAVLAACQTNPITPAEKREIRRSLGTLQFSLNARSFAMLRPILAPTVQLNGSPTELSMAALLSGVQWSATGVNNIQILSASKLPDGIKTKVALYTGRGAAVLEIQFDEAGKIRSIDFVPWGSAPRVSVPASFTSDFVTANGLMFVKATANGKTGYFLFDTGSSNLLLNQKYFAPNVSGGMLDFHSGVTGLERPLGNVQLGSLRWGGLRVDGITGKLVDFSRLEGPANTPLLGAISHNEVKDCAVVIDWKQQQLQIIATNRDGSQKVATSGPPPTAVIPFTNFLHFPLFPASVGGQNFEMLFDSGAQGNLLPNESSLGDHFRQLGVTGLSGGSQDGRALAFDGTVDETVIGGAVYRDLPFAIYQVPYVSGKGVFGAPLYHQSRMEINFRARKILLWQ